MNYCGKCGEPIDKTGNLICNNCFSPTQPAKDLQASDSGQIPVEQQASDLSQIPVEQQVSDPGQAPVDWQASDPGQIPVEQQASDSGQISVKQQASDLDQAPVDWQASDMGACPTETEDISKAFYTTETGEILPLYHQRQQEDSKPKKKFLLPLLIGAGVIAVIAIAIGLIASGIFASPVDRFIAIQRNHVIDPLLAVYDEAEDVEYSFDLILTAGGEVSGLDSEGIMALTIIEQLALEMNVNTSIDPMESIFGLTFSFAGADLLSAVITADEDHLGFSIPTVNDTYYIISYEAFEELLGGGGDGPIFVPEMTPEEASSFIERYSDILLSIVNEDNLEVNRETVSLFNGREELNAPVYTVTPTEEDFYNFLLAILEEVKEDELMYQLFTASATPQMLNFMGYETTSEYWNSILNELEDTLGEAAETLADSNFRWRVATHRGQLILQEITFDANDVNVLLKYEGFLSGNQRTDWFSIRFGMGNNEEVFFTLNNDVTASRTEANGNAELAIDVRTGLLSELNISVNVSYDLDLTTSSILEFPYGSYDIDFSLLEGFTETSFRASLVVDAGEDGGSDHLITIYNLDDLGLSYLTINIHSTDEPSGIQAPTGRIVDLSDMSEMELLFTFIEIAGELESLFNLFNQL